jgi:hypothetical protein
MGEDVVKPETNSSSKAETTKAASLYCALMFVSTRHTVL